MSCLFCDIVAGEQPAEVVLADEVATAFLDHRPLFEGHCLLVPNDHVETLLELPTDLLEPFFGRAQRLAGAMTDALGAAGSFVAMNNRISQSVPHLHVHVVPRWHGDVNFISAVGQIRVIPSALDDMARRYREVWAAMRPSP